MENRIQQETRSTAPYHIRAAVDAANRVTPEPEAEVAETPLTLRYAEPEPEPVAPRVLHYHAA
jgi:hypothetical protein